MFKTIIFHSEPLFIISPDSFAVLSVNENSHQPIDCKFIISNYYPIETQMDTDVKSISMYVKSVWQPNSVISILFTAQQAV